MGIKNPSWEKASSKFAQKSLIVEAHAIQKRGKTNFSLTSPGPIAYFDFNLSSRGVIEKFAGVKEIYRAKEPYICTKPYKLEDGPKGKILRANQEGWIEVWERFKTDFLEALGDSSIRSLVVDTATESWETIRIARLGASDHIPPSRYGPVNAEFASLVERALDPRSNKNLTLTNTMGDEYIGTITKDGKDVSVRTGRLKVNQFKGLPGLAEVIIELLRDDSQEEVEDKFGLRIVDSRMNPAVNGLELWGGQCNFPWMAVNVMPDTNIEDWL